MWRLRVDREGRVLGMNGFGSTFQGTSRRVATVNLEAIAQSFAPRVGQGQMTAQLSPADSVRATVGNAHIAIDYSRPSRRGRQIFGGVVPWGQVWRTGANAATSFTTDAPLDINGVTVPAGSYTLWSIPSPSGWKLIINKQTRQWGTVYHAEQDLARIDMQTAALPTPVEQFQITVEPTSGQAGVLALQWDTTRAYVPFTVKPSSE